MDYALAHRQPPNDLVPEAQVVGDHETERTNTATGSCVVVGVDIEPRALHNADRALDPGPALVPRVLVDLVEGQPSDYVRDHEAGHLKIEVASDSRNCGHAYDGAACSKVDGIYKKWSKQLEAAQEAYDKREYARSVTGLRIHLAPPDQAAPTGRAGSGRPDLGLDRPPTTSA